jgi:FKBP-type peptidyl-prolyl cis-trans isomerase FklB
MCDKGVLNLGGVAMKSPLKIVLAVGLLAATSVAQDTPEDKQPATNTTATKPEATPHSTTSKKKLPREEEESPIVTEQDRRGYAVGVELGLDIARKGADLNQHLLMQGMRDALAGKKYLMTAEDMNAVLTAMHKEQLEKMALARQEFAEKNKKDGEAFLAANKAKDGVVTLPSGLQYKILKAGEGNKPAIDDKVVCHYRGSLLDGTEIDSSYQRKEPATFPLKGVIKGWAEALQLMPVGSKWQVFIPSDLGYGSQGNGSNIGPNATLIFEVELLSIQSKAQDQAGPQGTAVKPQGM